MLFAAWGCYSSIAATPKIDPDTDDADLPFEETGSTTDACAPRKPWEGPGVTGVLPIDSRTALVLNGDRYFTAEFDIAGGDASDANMGRLVAWRERGHLKDLWSKAPAVIGAKPWDDPGVTAAYIDKTSGAQVIISQFRRWVRQGDDWLAGSVVEDWVVNDAGPPIADGGRAPWEGPGVTSAYFVPGGSFFHAISQDKQWVRRTSDPDQKNWSWIADSGVDLVTIKPWSTAPGIGGRRPFEGKGVTAAYYIGSKLFVISVDRMWTTNGTTWVASGELKSMPVWSSAPSADCPR